MAAFREQRWRGELAGAPVPADVRVREVVVPDWFRVVDGDDGGDEWEKAGEKEVVRSVAEDVADRGDLWRVGEEGMEAEGGGEGGG